MFGRYVKVMIVGHLKEKLANEAEYLQFTTSN